MLLHGVICMPFSFRPSNGTSATHADWRLFRLVPLTLRHAHLLGRLVPLAQIRHTVIAKRPRPRKVFIALLQPSPWMGRAMDSTQAYHQRRELMYGLTLVPQIPVLQSYLVIPPQSRDMQITLCYMASML